jgi:hypothetical protein
MSSPPLQPRREQVPAGERDAYDAVIARLRVRFGHPSGPPDEYFDAGPYFGPMLISPPLCHVASQMGAFLIARGAESGSYSHTDREFAWQVLSAKLKTNGGQSVHIVDAVRAGVRLDAIAALRRGTDDELSDDERLLAAYVRQVVDGLLNDETHEAMESRLGVRGLFEYTGMILWFQWSMRMEQWVRLPTLADSEVDELIAALGAPPAQ